MAPLSSLLTAGATSNLVSKPLGRAPITTQEKIAHHKFRKAAALKPKVMSPPPPSADAPGPEKKKRKTKCLPPPGEAFQEPEPDPKGSANTKRRKPVTTQEKQKEHERKRREAKKKEVQKAIQRTLDGQRRYQEEKARKYVSGKEGGCGEAAKIGGAGGEAEPAETAAVAACKGGQGKSKSKAKATYPSTIDLMGMCATPSANKFEDIKGRGKDKAKGSGVLYRRTTRARDEKRLITSKATLARAKAPPRAPVLSMLPKPGEKEKEEPFFRLMDLPEKVRTKIWKLRVVHHPYCVCPGQPRGREQPDLAMSGWDVRDEVLPIYYANNVFSVDITPLSNPESEPEIKGSSSKGLGPVGESGEDEEREGGKIPEQLPDHNKSTKPSTKPSTTKLTPDPIAEIKPWVHALESGGHLSQIQHWVFDCAPETVIPPSRILKLDEAKSLVVYLNIWRQSVECSEISEGASEPSTTPAAWRAKVEVHSAACCVLPKQEQYQKCIIKPSPDWLNGVANVVLRAAEAKGRVAADLVIGVANILRDRAHELVDSKCDLPS